MSAAGAMDEQVSSREVALDASQTPPDTVMNAISVPDGPKRKFWFSGIAICYLVFVTATLGASMLLLAASIRVH